MATNPNVPASQAEAAKSSAPDAKVVANQPAQQSSATPSTSTAAAPVSTAAAPTTSVPVDAVKRDAKDSDDKAAKKVSADRAEEQKIGKELDKKNEGADYFEQVANNDEVTVDPWREQARLDRQREAEMEKGDPTRDPVAKQAAMDMNTPEPGAQEEAKEIRDAGKK